MYLSTIHLFNVASGHSTFKNLGPGFDTEFEWKLCLRC